MTMNEKVILQVYPVRLNPETVEGLRQIAKADRRPWSTYLRNLAEDHVESKLKKVKKVR